MMTLFLQNINILAIELPSLRISPLLLRIVTTVLLYAGALYFSVIYIQSIGSGIGVCSLLLDCPAIFQNYGAPAFSWPVIFLSSLVPVLAVENKPSKRLTKAEKHQLSLNAELKGILVGLILGDLYVAKTNVNPWLNFKQGAIHTEYLFHLYELFKLFCSSVPKLRSGKPDPRTGKVYSCIYFQTYCLPCFNELHKLFYVEGKKVIPSNISDLLTLEGLCYWICDDGYLHGNGVHFCTDSFSLEEVNLLAKTLTEKFTLKCTVYKKSSNYRIRISSKSMAELQNMLSPIMPSMMRYKIGL